MIRLAPVFVLFVSLCNLASATDYENIITVAGNGSPDRNIDSGEAFSVNIGQPFGVEIGPEGYLYVTEVSNHRILKIDLRTGRTSTVAGNGIKGYSGDGGPATQAQLFEPYEVRFTANGDMYFVEMQNHLIRKVDAATGRISTVAGTGKQGFSGDAGPAIEAQFYRPHSIALSENERYLYVADIGNHRIRRIDLELGTIDTIAGNGKKRLPKDGQEIKDQALIGPRALYRSGNDLWIALREGHSIWRLDLNDGRIHHVAGTGKKGFSGDDGPAKAATFNGPKGIVQAPNGNLYVVDTENQAIREIDLQENLVRTVAGMGPKHRGYRGDGLKATQAQLDRPHGIGVAEDNSLFIGDTNNHRVRQVVAKP